MNFVREKRETVFGLLKTWLRWKFKFIRQVKYSAVPSRFSPIEAFCFVIGWKMTTLFGVPQNELCWKKKLMAAIPHNHEVVGGT